MFRSKLIKLSLSLITAIALSIPGASTTLAAPPSNDNFADAAVITTLPFSTTVDISEATAEPGEPQYCEYLPWTVWFSYTPSTEVILRVDMEGTQIWANLNVYRSVGPGITDLDILDCTVYGGPITFTADAGVTYYFQAGSINETGSVQVNLEQIPPPVNDNFAEAIIIPGLPFTSDPLDNIGATIESGEPTPSCAQNPLSKSAWFAFTPDMTGSISADFNYTHFTSLLAAYTGTSLSDLKEVACKPGERLTFLASAGTTYYFQVSSLWGDGGPFQFHLDVAQQPVAGFNYWPWDPSVYDIVDFENWSWDPAEAGFQTIAWDFGDGSTSNEWSPDHMYPADGDYTVSLTVTTVDGRNASTSQVVLVRTHDVAITRVAAPRSASAGQTRQISVYIRNHRYPETVSVELYRSTPGGFEWIGGLRQFVPVRQGNRTTRFDFTYTFTSDDAQIGKVTFKALASFADVRDALPADNEAISSPPTKVQ